MVDKEFLRRFLERIKNINAISAFITLVASIIVYVVYMNDYILKEVDDLSVISKDYTILLLSFVIILYTLILLGISIAMRAKRRKERADIIISTQFIKAVHKLVRVWTSLAQSTAECDSRLFEYLYLYRLAGDESVTPAFNLASKQIVEVLDYAASAFRILTHEECGVAIKCAILNSDTLQTIYRDKSSYQLRGSRDRRAEPLSLNKPMDAIARVHQSHYVEDDLKTAAYHCDYTNSRTDWNDHYNATIVHPIDIYGDQKSDHKMFLLCVDNINGGFKNEFSLYLIRYISNRVSAMLYRVDMLEMIKRTT